MIQQSHYNEHNIIRNFKLNESEPKSNIITISSQSHKERNQHHQVKAEVNENEIEQFKVRAVMTKKFEQFKTKAVRIKQRKYRN